MLARPPAWPAVTPHVPTSSPHARTPVLTCLETRCQLHASLEGWRRAPAPLLSRPPSPPHLPASIQRLPHHGDQDLPTCPARVEPWKTSSPSSPSCPRGKAKPATAWDRGSSRPGAPRDTDPLLDLQVRALHELWQPLHHELRDVLGRVRLRGLLPLLQDGCVQLHHILHVHGLDVAGQGGDLGPQHGLEGLLGLLQVPVDRAGPMSTSVRWGLPGPGRPATELPCARSLIRGRRERTLRVNRRSQPGRGEKRAEEEQKAQRRPGVECVTARGPASRLFSGWDMRV